MTYRIRIAIFLIVLYASAASAAEKNVQALFQFSLESLKFSHCATIFWGRSKHLRTDTPFNEENPGAGLMCYENGKDGAYIAFNRIFSNSLTGQSNAYGFGWEKVFLGDTTSWHLGGGAEFVHLDYEVPEHGRGRRFVPAKIRRGEVPFLHLYGGYGPVNLRLVQLVPGKIYFFGVSVAY